MVIPEFVPTDAFSRILHNQTANLIRRHLRSRENVIIIDVAYHIPGLKQLEAYETAEDVGDLERAGMQQIMPQPIDAN